MDPEAVAAENVGRFPLSYNVQNRFRHVVVGFCLPVRTAILVIRLIEGATSLRLMTAFGIGVRVNYATC